MPRLPILVLGVAVATASSAAAEIPDTLLVLEGLTATLPGQVPEAAPPRFVLMEDGRVFVGGTRGLAAGRLERGEAKNLESRISRVRRLSGLGAAVTLGPGARRQRLLLRKGSPIVIQGDPAAAPVGLKPLAALIEDLDGFDHPSLKPYPPGAFALRVRAAPAGAAGAGSSPPAAAGQRALAGGCRAWSFPFSLAEALAAPRIVPSSSDWPTGANPASVCDGRGRYVVTHRPLLPGERP